MKFFKYISYLVLSTSLLACSDDVLNVDDNQLPDKTDKHVEKFYFSLSVNPKATPGTRAGELKSNSETPTSEENGLSDMKVVLALLGETLEGGSSDYFYDFHSPSNAAGQKTQTFKVIAYADVYPSGYTFETDNNGVSTVVGELDKNDLEDNLKTLADGGTDENYKVYVFVIANGKSNPQIDRPVLGRNIQRQISAKINYNVTEPDPVNGGNITNTYSFFDNRGVRESQDNNFLMTNEKGFYKEFKLSDIYAHLDESDPFPLTDYKTSNNNDDAISIYRMAARVDMNYWRTKFAFVNGSDEAICILPTGSSESAITYGELPTNTRYTVTLDGFAIANAGLDYMLFHETGFPGDGSVNATPFSDSDGIWNILNQEIVESSPYDNQVLYMRDPKGYSKGYNYNNDLFYQPFANLISRNAQGNVSATKLHSETFKFTDISELNLKAENGKDNEQSGSDKKYTTYHYLLPNAIHNKERQLKKNTTAVIFRGRIEDGNIDNQNNIIEQAAEKGDDLFAFYSDIIGNYNAFLKKALESKKDGLRAYVLFSYIWEEYWYKKITVNRNKSNDLSLTISNLENEISTAGEDFKSELEDQLEFKKQELLDSVTNINKYYGYLSAVKDFDSDSENYDEEVNRVYDQLKNLVDGQDDVFRSCAVSNNISVYRAKDIAQEDNVAGSHTPQWVYYCYYYYWIRHNNNDDSNTMADMEFAIVRNYVYKLSITKLFDLGYPEDPGDDPEPENPDDPVEGKDVKLLIETKVLPWGKRIDDNITLF